MSTHWSRRAFLGALASGACASAIGAGDAKTTWLTATDVHVPGYPTIEAL